jgi:hypothetical protein
MTTHSRIPRHVREGLSTLAFLAIVIVIVIAAIRVTLA